jgi:hypothetical protein
MAERKLVNFKYRSGSAALRSLSDGTLYFARPDELNDSLEAKFVAADPASFQQRLAQTLTELAVQRGERVKYVAEEDVAEHYIRMIQEEDTAFATHCQKVGICSGTKRPDNQPLWAYYCNDSRGFCFEFEWPHNVVNEFNLLPTFVHYTAESRIHDRFEDMHAELVEVGKQNPSWSMEQIHEHFYSKDFLVKWLIRSMGRAVSNKHVDWAHEAELRMLSPIAGPLPILKSILKRVYFTRTDFPEWGPVQMLLHQLYPDVELAQVIFNHTEPLVRIQPMHKKLIPVTMSGTEQV